MNPTEAMRHRRSVRTFDGNPLRAEDAEKLMDFARRVENPYDLPITWKLLDAGRDGLSAPVITGGQSYIAGKLRKVPHAEEAFGYTFEKILLYAETLGLGSTWIAGTMDRPAFERAMALGEGEVMPCVSPVGYPAKKMSLRETMMRKGVQADTRLDFSELFFEGGLDKPLTPESAGTLREALELVRLAPSAVNKQPWRVLLSGNAAHFYLKRSKGFLGEDGWDLQKIDLGIALSHFELGAQEAGLHPAFTLEDPDLDAGDLVWVASFRLN